VAYILSLEIGGRDLRTLVANMTEPVRLLGEGRAAFSLPEGVQYVAREVDAERAQEIAGEFYPNGEDVAEEPVRSGSGESEKDEQLARISELARRLGFNEAKTKMLIGQAASDLVALERKLLSELEEKPSVPQTGNGWNGRHARSNMEASRTQDVTAEPGAPRTRPGETPVSIERGFLF